MRWVLTASIALALCTSSAGGAAAATLDYAGSHFDVGGTFFPGGGLPHFVVPWRSEAVEKPFDLDGNNVYGSAGYALFATQFNYPNVGCCGSPQPFESPTWPNLIDLPDFVTDSRSLVTNKVGGWGYALVDDPTLVNGYRDYNWGMDQDPPRPGPDQSPYVKIGSLEGTDIHGNDPRTSAVGAGRFEFTVGDNVPNHFRVGVMADGLDANNWTASEVLVHQVSGATILDTATTGTLPIGNILGQPDYVPGINRMVDMHFVDIIGAQPGDTFAIYAKAFDNGFGAIAGISFDVVPEPTSMALVTLAAVAIGGLARRRRA